METFGFSEVQAQEIVNMRLYQLTGMERERLEKELSELERRVLYLHLMGTDYKTIAKLLDRSPKTIDNALQRIKGKMQKILEKEK